jgi:hypothetical protein
MGIGEITKQLAQQAIGDAIAGPETPTATAVTPAAAPEGVGSTIVGELNAMQRGMKEDQELVVTCTVNNETIRVRDIYAPTWRVAVITGMGQDKSLTRVICPFESLQLVCKPLPVQAGAAPLRVRIVTPKPTA